MFIRAFFIFVVVALVGCASNPMVVSSKQDLVKPASTESQVIFMRSSFIGSAIGASLYEVSDGNIKFIGIINNGTKIAYSTKPGKHVFMVVSEAADFMEADLAPGKNYFSITTPRMGAWVARFSLWPIKKTPGADYHTGMPEFNQWVSTTKVVENTDKSEAWYEKNKDSVKKKYEKYWPEWQNKSQEDLERRTLSVDDGM